MLEIIKISAVVFLGIWVGSWLAMSHCGHTKLRMTGLMALRVSFEVMVQFPWLCWRIFTQKLRAPIKISKLEATDLDYIAVFPLDQAQHSAIYLGRKVWEARAEGEIRDILARVKSQSSECYGIVHLKSGSKASWIYRQGKFSVSHTYDCDQSA